MRCQGSNFKNPVRVDGPLAWVTRIRFRIDPLWIMYSNTCVFMIVFIVSVWKRHNAKKAKKSTHRMLNLVPKQLNSLTLLSMMKMKALGHHEFTFMILARISKMHKLLWRGTHWNGSVSYHNNDLAIMLAMIQLRQILKLPVSVICNRRLDICA